MRMACGRFVAGVADPRARRRDRRSGCRHGRPDDRRPAPPGTMDHGRVARPRRADRHHRAQLLGQRDHPRHLVSPLRPPAAAVQRVRTGRRRGIVVAEADPGRAHLLLGLGAVLQALATPDFSQHFPDPAYFRFYVAHGGVLAAAVFLVAGRRIVPRPGAPLRVFLTTIAFAAVAGLADVLTNGNYMYLRVKPVAGSLLNVMGPWPWYIASGAVLAIAFLTLLNAPFWLARRRARLAGVGQHVLQVRSQHPDAGKRETEGD